MLKRTDEASKIIKASPERIYRALSDPDELIAWLPPKGMTGRFEHYDFQVNGGYCMVLTYDPGTAGSSGKSSETTDIVDVRFGEIEPNHRIVQLTHFQSDDPAFAGTMTMTWTLDRSAPAQRSASSPKMCRTESGRKITLRVSNPLWTTCLSSFARAESKLSQSSSERPEADAIEMRGPAGRQGHCLS
jgi:uncharacterized protein YndB with AHSA1/START domain